MKYFMLVVIGLLMIFGFKSEADDMLKDSQIVKAVLTANKGEIDAGKLAKSKAENKSVKEFAAMMVMEHSKNSKDLKALAHKKHLGMGDESRINAIWDEKGSSKLDDLKANRKGPSFDKAYMDAQIEMHQDVLDGLDTQLIPGVMDPDLKEFLQDTRKHVEMHMEKAKEIRKSIM